MGCGSNCSGELVLGKETSLLATVTASLEDAAQCCGSENENFLELFHYDIVVRFQLSLWCVNFCTRNFDV